MARDVAPTLYTVEEAARLLRVGRTKAYAMTKEWRATGGRSGLPVVDFGNVLRVPRAALERVLGVDLCETAAPAAPSNAEPAAVGDPPAAQPTTPTPTPDASPQATRPSRPRTSLTEPRDQLDLFVAR